MEPLNIPKQLLCQITNMIDRNFWRLSRTFQGLSTWWNVWTGDAKQSPHLWTSVSRNTFLNVVQFFYKFYSTGSS